MIYFNQNDYDKVAYNKPDGTKATVKSSGCGVVAACIVFDNYVGKTLYTPAQMAAFSIAHKARINYGTNEATLLKALCAENKGFSFKVTNNVDDLVKHLKSGGMAICNQGDKYNVFSTGGHYVVAYRMNGNNIEVVDPSMYAGKYDSYARPTRIVKKTEHGCIVTAAEMKKATQDRNPCYYLVSYEGVKTVSKTYYGIDISEHNGTVDWAKVAKKVDFAILRICWVGNTQNKMDKLFEKNYAAAKKAGVKLGAYVYIYSKTAAAATKGAEWVLKQIKGKTFELPIYCDMEDPTIAGLGKTKLTAITDAFNAAIKKGGYRVGIYASLDWFRNKLNSTVKKYYTWIAHYTSGTDKYKGEYQMWQNSSKGKVDGVKGNVDTNYLYENIFSVSASTLEKPKTPASSAPTYTAGKTYTLQTDLKVRKGAGTKYAQKLLTELTANGKKNAKSGKYAVLKKGTRVTAQKVIKEGNNIWLQIPSGYVAAYYNKNKYIK